MTETGYQWKILESELIQRFAQSALFSNLKEGEKLKKEFVRQVIKKLKRCKTIQDLDEFAGNEHGLEKKWNFALIFALDALTSWKNPFWKHGPTALVFVLAQVALACCVQMYEALRCFSPKDPLRSRGFSYIGFFCFTLIARLEAILLVDGGNETIIKPLQRRSYFGGLTQRLTKFIMQVTNSSYVSNKKRQLLWRDSTGISLDPYGESHSIIPLSNQLGILANETVHKTLSDYLGSFLKEVYAPVHTNGTPHALLSAMIKPLEAHAQRSVMTANSFFRLSDNKYDLWAIKASKIEIPNDFVAIADMHKNEQMKQLSNLGALSMFAGEIIRIVSFVIGDEHEYPSFEEKTVSRFKKDGYARQRPFKTGHLCNPFSLNTLQFYKFSESLRQAVLAKDIATFVEESINILVRLEFEGNIEELRKCETFGEVYAGIERIISETKLIS